MNATTQHLAEWHTELVDELAQARDALPSLHSEFDVAEAAARQTTIAYRELQATLAGAGRLAAPITMRLAAREADRDAARGRGAKARGVLEAARGRVAELERAVAQLDALLIPADAEEAA
jgi:chromosome segregation ATPase